MALEGKTVEDMRAHLRDLPQWHERHDPKPGPQIRGRLRSNGPRLFDDAGPWKWKMATGFDALRLLITGGETQLRTYLAWINSIKGNGIRVFCNWKVTGLDFRQVPDYMGWVRKLCVLTRSVGMRVECCAVCDFIPEGLAAQQQFINSLAAVLAEFDHAILTFGNEPYQNVENPEAIAPPQAPGLLIARGMCNPNDPNALPYLPWAGFTAAQTLRSDDWPRKVGKDGFEIRNGFGGTRPDGTVVDFRGTKTSCINTEMMGAAETCPPGRRSRSTRGILHGRRRGRDVHQRCHGPRRQPHDAAMRCSRSDRSEVCVRAVPRHRHRADRCADVDVLPLRTERAGGARGEGCARRCAGPGHPHSLDGGAGAGGVDQLSLSRSWAQRVETEGHQRMAYVSAGGSVRAQRARMTQNRSINALT